MTRRKKEWVDETHGKSVRRLLANCNQNRYLLRAQNYVLTEDLLLKYPELNLLGPEEG